MNPPPAWLQAPWCRVLAIVIAVLVLGYALLVPTSLLYLAIGSIECLGPGCATANGAAVAGGVVGLLIGIATAALLIVLAARPRTALLIAALIGLILLPVALLGQAWGVRTLSDGRSIASEASQLGFAIDTSMQEVLVSVTGANSMQQPGILGPEQGLIECEGADGPGYQATSRLTFTPGSSIGAAERDALASEFTASRGRMILIPASIELQQEFAQADDGWSWTVTSGCQPLPVSSPDDVPAP